MHNLYTKKVKILEICKLFSENLVNEYGNIPRRGPIPKFSDLEVVALSLAAESESINDCSIYGDKGYIGADIQLDLFTPIRFKVPSFLLRL
ncbi:hypothetical protein FHS60_001444 [Alloprevotella rava]|uniref:Transposase n=1 Tax=Alloprevotella rava TaxID=671218 RepID=A0A7W5YGC4_9BACT|nr:hypothetical protein [Alloprevotella rava]